MENHPRSWLWEGFSVKLDGVTNVYGCSKLYNFNRKAEEVLVASENCFKSVRFDRADNLRGTTSCVKLPGLPEVQSTFTVLAIDCFTNNELNIICVVFINCQSEEDALLSEPFSSDLSCSMGGGGGGSGDQSKCCCINFYSCPNASDDSSVSNPIDYYEQSIAYNPTMVTNAFLTHPHRLQNVFLVPCENSLIHVFSDTSTDSSFKFTELPQNETALLFPEFNFDENYLTQPDQPLPLILWMDVFYVPSDERKRLSAVAWENGNVQLSLCHLSTDATVTENSGSWDASVELVFCKVICFDGPVTQLRFFNRSPVQMQEEEGNSQINLVVCTALEFVYVYHDVVNCIFSRVVHVDDSNLESDCVLCCACYDIDMDSTNEIVIGTFYQQIAAFKYSPQRNVYELMWDRKYPGPVRGLQVVDLSNDGINDLIVMTNNTVHIMQHNIAQIATLCKEKLLAYVDKLQNSGKLEPLDHEQLETPLDS